MLEHFDKKQNVDIKKEVETNDFQSIKSEVSKDFEKVYEFWDNIFSNGELLTTDEVEENLVLESKNVDSFKIEFIHDDQQEIKFDHVDIKTIKSEALIDSEQVYKFWDSIFLNEELLPIDEENEADSLETLDVINKQFISGDLVELLDSDRNNVDKNENPNIIFDNISKTKVDIPDDISDSDKESDEDEKRALTEEQKEKIKEETGWSDEIIDALKSWEEYEIYKKADLVEVEINGRKCLVRQDIDWEQKDSMGRTNKERSEQGLSPITKDGKTVELHHIGQKSNGPLAELTQEEHRGKGNDAILHDKNKKSEIDRQAFSQERNEHWVARSQGSEGNK